ncbi:hypothetical protein BH20ACT6_BH20ACT6_00880 [soil metagenome]
MQPLDYPGSPATVPGLLTRDGDWRELGGDPVPGRLRRGRVCVVAVGSNAAPQVLAAKLRAAGVPVEVALVPCRLDGLAVAHSAHVSPAGYVATTALAAPGERTPVVASWFTDDQLTALDATEPNYTRRALPTTVTGAPTGAETYVSRWGVLAPGGVALAPTTQRDVHRLLATDPELAGLLPRDDGPATVRALLDPPVRDRVRQRLVDLGWVSPTGL